VTRPRATALQFRQLTLEDLPLLHRWLNAGPVLRWYAKRPLTQQEVNDKYAPRASGNSPVKVHLAFVDAKPSGMFQFYPLTAFPEYAAALGARPGWYVTDFFLGEAEARGRGLASELLLAFETLVRQAAPDYTALVAGPHPANKASIRTLRRAGYAFKREVEVAPGEFELLMVRDRPVF